MGMTKTPFKPIMIVKFVVGKTYDLCFAKFSISFFPKEFEVGHASDVNHVHRCRIESMFMEIH
jgi:hypothetical protein